MNKIVCNVCSKTIIADNYKNMNYGVPIIVKLPHGYDIHLCSEDCGITFFKKRKVDIEFMKELNKEK